ncbi:T9SS type A sorting domain-containing protein [Hyunsoonleella rubra]|uniref:Spondin domain-containing protein n=1 Tax=Hyunsoonleella rubra TaxID=1737062 RepID=A0ABW5TEK2_9FLAO
MKKITFLLSFLICAFSFGQSVATYNITFTNFWNSTDHSIGTTFPGSNAHWSDLVGVNHNNNVSFLQMGAMATTGVENIAELGNFTVFQTVEVQNAIDANNAERFFNAGDLFLNEPTNTIIYTGLEVSEDYPLLTMLSMIAPSPDWFIAINGLNLRNGGTWETSITMDLFPYDAGTEDGTDYSLSNNDTNDNITSAQGVAPFNSAKVATIEIELQSVLSNDGVSELDGISIFPNPVSDNLRLRNLQNTNLKHVEIYSVLGKLSRSIPIENNVNNLDIDVSDLASGIYLLKLQNELGFSKTQKLIIR